jgi:hypothetical protein
VAPNVKTPAGKQAEANNSLQPHRPLILCLQSNSSTTVSNRASKHSEANENIIISPFCFGADHMPHFFSFYTQTGKYFNFINKELIYSEDVTCLLMLWPRTVLSMTMA